MCDSQKRHARTCVYCQREWQAKCPTARYCSTRCQHLASGDRVILACHRCGVDFECRAMEMRAGRQFCSKACMLDARRRTAKLCLECGGVFAPKLRKDPRKGKGLYCGKKCAGAARRAGNRDGRWREAQELKACRAKVKPSQLMYAALQRAMSDQMQNIRSLWRAINDWRPCLHCGGPLKSHATEKTMFCSIACASQYEYTATCNDCGEAFAKVGKQGKAFRCKKCQVKRARFWNRQSGTNIASRARKYGVVRVRYRRFDIFERDSWRCQLCNVRLLRKWTYGKKSLTPHPDNATIDHIVPMSKGGADAEWNLQSCCFRCNTKKGARLKGQLRFKL